MVLNELTEPVDEYTLGEPQETVLLCEIVGN